MKPFIPTPETSTIDGSRWSGGWVDWDDLDWSAAEWRETSTLMDVVVGPDQAPSDPHWRVPHKTEGTFHRIRKARKLQRPKAKRTGV